MTSKEKTSKLIFDTLRECAITAINAGHRDLPPYDLDFTLRGRTAGMLKFMALRGKRGYVKPSTVSDCVLRFNTSMLAKNGPEATVETVRHEFAHLLAVSIEGAKGHGAVWKRYAKLLGSNGDPYHSFEKVEHEVRRTRTVKAACDCTQHDITVRRANMMRAGRKYMCRACKGRLRLV
jgi:predicted SprT family Zn-dependent metalloprotease